MYNMSYMYSYSTLEIEKVDTPLPPDYPDILVGDSTHRVKMKTIEGRPVINYCRFYIFFYREI